MEPDIRRYTANFHLTHNCNMRCGYCYAGEKLNASMDEAVIAQSIDFVVQQVEQRNANKLVLAFLGGEPLMEIEKLFSIQDEFRKRLNDDIQIVAQLSTNGLLLTDQLMAELTKREILISLSLDGTPETMQRQRPTLGNSDYSRTMDKVISNVLRHNPFTNAFCVITPESAGDVFENVTWIYDRGIRFINTTLDYSAEWTHENFKELEREYKKLAKWYEQKANAIEHFYLSCFDERIQSRTKEPVDCSRKCSIGNNQISISPEGVLYPCMQFVKPKHEADSSIKLGDLTSGLDKNAVTQMQSDIIKDKPECNGCVLKDRCSTWCSCINYASTKTVSKASPVACYHEQTLIPIVDAMSNKLWKERNQLFIQKHYNPLYSFVAQAMG